MPRLWLHQRMRIIQLYSKTQETICRIDQVVAAAAKEGIVISPKGVKLIVDKYRRTAKQYIRYVAIGGAIGVTAWDLVACVHSINGESMRPLLNPKNNIKDQLLLHPIKMNKIKRGDVVTFISPKNPDDVFIKRIIALPGDIVRTISYKKELVLIPPGHCWVEGDNHKRSIDSNTFGILSMGLLVFKASYIIWPLTRFSKIQNDLPSYRLLIPFNNLDNEIKLEIQEYFNTDITSNKMSKISKAKDDNEESINYFVDFLPYSVRNQ